jgi:hypothetical protein
MSGHVWYFILGFGVLAWGCFLVSAVLTVPGQATISWVLGLFGLGAAVIAGMYAAQTWIGDLVGWFIGLGWLTAMAAFVGLLVLCILTVLAILWDKIAPKVVLSLPLAMAWVLAISALQHGAVPGNVGHGISTAVGQIGTLLVQKTSGAF